MCNQDTCVYLLSAASTVIRNSSKLVKSFQNWRVGKDSAASNSWDGWNRVALKIGELDRTGLLQIGKKMEQCTRSIQNWRVGKDSAASNSWDGWKRVALKLGELDRTRLLQIGEIDGTGQLSKLVSWTEQGCSKLVRRLEQGSFQNWRVGKDSAAPNWWDRWNRKALKIGEMGRIGRGQ